MQNPSGSVLNLWSGSRLMAFSGLDRQTDFYHALECEILAQFAQCIGMADQAQEWEKTHRELCELINQRLWNDEVGFYVDYDVQRNALSPVLAASGFLPLICGAAPIYGWTATLYNDLVLQQAGIKRV